MFINYFFAKVGFGNSLLSLPLSEARNGKDTFFWIGYSNQEIPVPSEEHFEAWEDPDIKYRDLYYLSLVSHFEKFRENCRIITYSNDKIQFWKVLGPIRPIASYEVATIVKYYESKENLISLYKEKKESAFSLSELLHGKHDKFGCKSVPVSLECEFFRDLLPACIDSLSVHRYLNSGTFRYLHAANKNLVADSVLPKFLSKKIIPIQLKPSGKSIYEGKFGCFARQYFDWLRSSTLKSFIEDRDLSSDELFELSTSIMSPAQLETAAAILIADLGMTIDVGIGKGLDVIDVRASIRHKSNWQDEVELILNSLGQLMGEAVHPAVSTFLRKHGTLAIQCKNYDDHGLSKEDGHLIYLQPNDSSGGRVISLAGIKRAILADHNSLKNFSDWLVLLQFNYKEDKKKLGLVQK